MSKVTNLKELDFLKKIKYYFGDNGGRGAQFCFSNFNFVNVNRSGSYFYLWFHQAYDCYTDDFSDTASIVINGDMIRCHYCVGDNELMTLSCRTQDLVDKLAQLDTASPACDPESLRAILNVLDFLTDDERASVRQIILALISKVPLIKNVNDPLNGIRLAFAPIVAVAVAGLPTWIVLFAVFTINGMHVAASNTCLLFVALLLFTAIFAVIYGKIKSDRLLDRFGNYEEYVARLLNQDDTRENN